MLSHGGAGGGRGRPCREQVDYMENRWSQALIVLSPASHTVISGTAINLGSLPELPGYKMRQLCRMMEPLMNPELWASPASWPAGKTVDS